MPAEDRWLSAKEALELGKLEAKIQKYDQALKKVDAQMGRNQRNWWLTKDSATPG